MAWLSKDVVSSVKETKIVFLGMYDMDLPEGRNLTCSRQAIVTEGIEKWYLNSIFYLLFFICGAR